MAEAAVAQPSWSPPVEMVDPAPAGQRIDEAGLLGNWYPARRPGAPGILLLGGSESALSTGNTQIACALQAEGFAVFHLSYFRAPGQSPSLELVPLELFDRGLAWLAARPGVDADRLGIVGTSKGAEAALLVASRNTAVKAVVAGVPSSVAWPGVVWEGDRGLMPKPSWTSGGRPVAVLPYGAFDAAAGIASVYENGLKSLDRHPEAAVPIENTRAAVLLVCGERDSLWPGCRMAKQLEARAAKAGRPSVALLSYPDAGHLAFGAPIAEGSPFYPRLGSMGGTVAGNASARADGWPRTLAFLRDRLR